MYTLWGQGMGRGDHESLTHMETPFRSEVSQYLLFERCCSFVDYGQKKASSPLTPTFPGRHRRPSQRSRRLPLLPPHADEPSSYRGRPRHEPPRDHPRVPHYIQDHGTAAPSPGQYRLHHQRILFTRRQRRKRFSRLCGFKGRGAR